MIQALIFLISSLLIFIIFTETVKLRIIYAESLSVEVHFTLFALFITQKSKQPHNHKKARLKGDRRIPLRKLINYASKLIPYSDIDLAELKLSIPRKEPAKNVLRRTGALSLLSIIFAYAKSKANFFHYNDITVLCSDNTKLKTKIDLSVTISLLRLITASAVLLKKDGDHNVGKQNERNDSRIT